VSRQAHVDSSFGFCILCLELSVYAKLIAQNRQIVVLQCKALLGNIPGVGHEDDEQTIIPRNGAQGRRIVEQ